MRSKSRAKRSNTELNPLIGDFINTIGQPRSFGDVCSLSGLPPQATIWRTSTDGFKVPESDVCTAANSTTTITSSANREQLRRNFRPSALADLASLRSRLWDLLANGQAAMYPHASFEDAISARR
jgi:hypothetical protein